MIICLLDWERQDKHSSKDENKGSGQDGQCWRCLQDIQAETGQSRAVSWDGWPRQHGHAEHSSVRTLESLESLDLGRDRG